MRTARADRPRLAGAGPGAGDRPVLLVTFFGVPFHPAAGELAVGSAVEAGPPLIVANLVELPPLPMSVCLGHDHLDYPPEVAAALRAPAERAQRLGVRVERLLVRSPRPVAALIQLASERRPGLLVLGPEPGRLSERFFRRVRRAVREKTDCLVWSADAGEEEPGARAGQPGGGCLPGAVRHGGAFDGGLGLGDQHLDGRAELGDGVLDGSASRRLVLAQLESQPAGNRQADQGGRVSGERPSGVQGGPGPQDRRERPVPVDRNPAPLAPGHPAADVLQVPCLL
jgi:hypothetical protein